MKRWLLACSMALCSSAAFAEYSFEVSNNTEQRIVAITVSEDGEHWANFNIGRGIRAGESAKLVWDESTDESGCDWWFRATFADGSQSEDVAFDFCEEGLALEFN